VAVNRNTILKIVVATIAALAAVWWLARSGVLKAEAVGAVLFLVAVDASFNAYSSINSSPWTYENMSGDGDRASSGSKYVWLANGAALVLGAFSAILASSAWPFVGAATVVVLMHSLYRHAMSTGEEQGNTGWNTSNGGGSSGAGSSGALTLVPSAAG
jgi:hypothetical protein